MRAMILANQGASSKYHFERLLTGLFTFHQQNKGVQIRLWLGNYLLVNVNCVFRLHQELPKSWIFSSGEFRGFRNFYNQGKIREFGNVYR